MHIRKFINISWMMFDSKVLYSARRLRRPAEVFFLGPSFSTKIWLIPWTYLPCGLLWTRVAVTFKDSSDIRSFTEECFARDVTFFFATNALPLMLQHINIIKLIKSSWLSCVLSVKVRNTYFLQSSKNCLKKLDLVLAKVGQYW